MIPRPSDREMPGPPSYYVCSNRMDLDADPQHLELRQDGMDVQQDGRSPTPIYSPSAMLDYA